MRLKKLITVSSGFIVPPIRL